MVKMMTKCSHKGFGFQDEKEKRIHMYIVEG